MSLFNPLSPLPPDLPDWNSAEYRQQQERYLAALFKPAVLGLIGVYLVLSLSYLLLGQVNVLFPLSWGISVVLIFLGHHLHQKPVAPRWANPLVCGLTLTLFIHAVLHSFAQSGRVNLLLPALVIIVSGAVSGSRHWWAGQTSAMLLTLVALSLRLPAVGQAWTLLTIALVGGTSATMFWLQTRLLRRLARADAAQRHQQQALRETLVSLHEQEEELRLYSEYVEIALFRTDARGGCTFTNRAWQRLITWQGTNYQGPWYAILHPDDRQAVENSWHLTSEFRTRLEGQYRLNIHNDRQDRWVKVSLSPVEAHGESGFIGTLEEITSLREAEQRLQQAAEEARTRVASQGLFLATMSHEIRTPMTAILGFTDELLDDPAIQKLLDNESIATGLHAIQRNGQHLLELINDILDHSRLEAGKLEMEILPTRVQDLVDDVVELLKNRAAAKGLPLLTELVRPVPAQIMTDPTRLRQILINLVGNAIKFTESGFVKMIVSYQRWAGSGAVPGTGQFPQRPGGVLHFDIIDTGIGLSAEQISRLFNNFTQADSTIFRQYGGSGLGLVISGQLARLLDGGITVHSEPGRGSLFRLSVAAKPVEEIPGGRWPLIPRLTPPPEPAPRAETPPESAPPPAEPAWQLTGHSILLAEDGIDNQKLISFILNKAGAQVTVADNGRQAYEQALRAERSGQPFHVILMDMQMPEWNGLRATRELRAAGYQHPIIALTANAMEEDRTACLKAGCTSFISKPIHKQTLIDRIRTVCSDQPTPTESER